jgi:hypothetical protein
MITEINTISDIIYDIKDKLKDHEYKTILECLAKIVPIAKEDDKLLIDYTNDFYKQFFFHHHKNNFQFNYTYFQQSNILWIKQIGSMPHQISINQQYLYSKSFNQSTRDIECCYARVLKIMPKYCIIDVSGSLRKISNKTLAKSYYYPYIKISPVINAF